MLASANGRAIYVGITSDLVKRVAQHREASRRSFTGRYRAHHLVWFEVHAAPTSAIQREKQLKAGSRGKKIEVIEAFNPGWRDLASEV